MAAAFRLRLRLALFVVPIALLVVSACASEEGAPQPAAAPAPPPAPATAARPAPSPAPEPTAPKRWSAPPPLTVNPNKKYVATVKTSKGTMEVELFAKEVPATVNNFVFLSREGFYNGVKFHRIIKSFMVQTGDPLGTGSGGPGYRFNDEPVTRKYVRGTMAMANAGPNTNGSQFFIIHQDYPLPPNYTIFGVVTKGLEVLDAIAGTPVQRNPSGEPSQPTETVTIESVGIVES